MKSKKLLLGLGAVTTALAPVAAVISCDNGKGSTNGVNNGVNKKTNKKAAFQAADLIKRIGKDDKGLIATIQIEGSSIDVYVSEADAKTETIVSFHGNKIVLPILTKGQVGMKAKVTYGKELFGLAKDGINSGSGTAQEKQDKIDKLGGEHVMDVTATATTAKVGWFVLNKNLITEEYTGAALNLQKLLTVKDGKGIYPFKFKEDTLKTLKPALTTESDAAFKKIFTDLGLKVTALEFAKAKTDSKEITVKTITIVKTSKQTDLTALIGAIGGSTLILNGTGSIAAATDVEIKAANTKMTGNQLLAKLNARNLSGVGSFKVIAASIDDALIKDDMHITFSITKPAVAAVAASGTGSNAVKAVQAVNGAATITISAGSLTPVTITVTLMVA